MDHTNILKAIFDSWNKPIVFVNLHHVVQYMNAPAELHYAKWGNLIGKSIFDCHNENSTQVIREVFERLQKGEEEVLITDNERHVAYMRGVRNSNGDLIGYYERYEPPRKQPDESR